MIYRVGVIGAGQIAQQRHLPVLAALPNVKVDWVADLDAASGQRVALVYNTSFLPLDGGKIKLPACDIALVAIPYGVRAPYYAALRGIGTRALFVEKPLARTRAEQAAIEAPYLPSNVACGYSRRASSGAEILKNIVKSGMYGKIRRIEYGWGGVGGVSFGEKHYGDIRKAGGGPLIEVGVHGMDLVAYLADAREVTIVRKSLVFQDGFDLHTEFEAVLQSDHGAVEFGCIVSTLRHTTNRLLVVFDLVDITWDLMGNGPVRVRSHRDGCEFEVRLSNGSKPAKPYASLAVFWSDFLGGVDCGLPNYTCAADMRVVTSLIESLYEGSAN